MNDNCIHHMQSFKQDVDMWKQFMSSSAYKLLELYESTSLLDGNDMKLHYFLICKHPPYLEFYIKRYWTNYKSRFDNLISFPFFDETMFDSFHTDENLKKLYKSHRYGHIANYVFLVNSLPCQDNGGVSIISDTMRANKHYAHLTLVDKLVYLNYCLHYKKYEKGRIANIHEICSENFALSIGENVFADNHVVSTIFCFL